MTMLLQLLIELCYIVFVAINFDKHYNSYSFLAHEMIGKRAFYGRAIMYVRLNKILFFSMNNSI